MLRYSYIKSMARWRRSGEVIDLSMVSRRNVGTIDWGDTQTLTRLMFR